MALNLEGLAYEVVPIDLRGGQHLAAGYKALNPQGLVPALVDDGRVMVPSPAIIEWLEERYPDPALLPADAQSRAQVRALAAIGLYPAHPAHRPSHAPAPAQAPRASAVASGIDRATASSSPTSGAIKGLPGITP